MFLVTSLAVPRGHQWGTFLHAAGPVHVLLVISSAARPRRRHRPARPRAWAGRSPSPGSGRPLGIFGSPCSRWPCCRRSAAVRAARRSCTRSSGRRMAIAGYPLDALSRSGHHQLPDLDGRDAAGRCPGAARRAAGGRPRPGPHVPRHPPHGAHRRPRAKHWPGDLEAGAPGSECFQPVDLGPPTISGARSARDDHGVRDRLPMTKRGPRVNGPYTREVDGGCTRHDGRARQPLRWAPAEASAAVGYSANTLRGVRERYREAYAEP